MIEFKFNIPLAPKEVWLRLTQPVHIHIWWDRDVSLEPEKRGRFFRFWTGKDGAKHAVTGRVTAFEPPRRMQLDYRHQEWDNPTRLEFMIDSDGSSGTSLYVQHSGWDAIADETARVREVDTYAKEWQSVMQRFADYCAGKK
jgi:uncharacterized protein YndB with AHSA1/START domain